ncbi:ABC transporter substrate-binding protein [Chelativorans sp. YIM 93263]|uniref:ABC transporter substrate-binding protein n=1 Tax=Chelativorans sp. YIM 93263 TaxID=2906648 RepID=UPI00237989EE|nr:ABC transporter substrate-binding protein [Chelativorans sp. YIM 93263]
MAVLTFGRPAFAADIRVGILEYGTVAWELDVIDHHGLAEKRDLDLEIVRYGGEGALDVALNAGAVDIVVSDWLWVSRQRHEGRSFTLVPYSTMVGSLMVSPDADAATLADLKGKQIGIAGGALDKNWLLMRAYARSEEGADLADIAEPTFAAPPLLNELMLRGDLPAVINYWHYGARLEAAGMKRLIDVEDILEGLGVHDSVPLLGWVFDEDWAEENSKKVQAFLDASYEAKKILGESEEEWTRIRPLVQAEDDATLKALMINYRRGIPRTFGERQVEAAEETFAVLYREGGGELTGGAENLTPGTFWSGFRLQDSASSTAQP